MTKKKFRAGHNGVNHGKLRGWLVRERDTEEINANRNIEGRA